MAVQFPNGFTITSSEPIDSKLVLTKAEMRVAETELSMPDTYFCVCKDDDKFYVYDVNNTVDEVTGKFRVLEAAGSLDEYIKSANVNENVLHLVKKDNTEVVFETKTVNNQSLVGNGNLEVQPISEYVDLSQEDATSLDAKVNTGIYKISHASDKPTNTSESGNLAVNKLTSTKIEQNWYSDTNYAHRILDTDGPEPEVGFYVNDVLQTPDEHGDVVISFLGVPATGWKEADLVKHLRGNLNGQVIIESNPATKLFVTLVLDGVNITSNNEYVIYCDNSTELVSDETRLCIEVSENKINTLTSMATGAEVSSFGCIHCESDLFVSGTGFLNLNSENGHGIKAGDTLISGRPHITIDTKHDGIHSKLLQIAGGYFTIKHANDAFSSGSKKKSGVLKVSGGEITVEHCLENVFQAKRAEEGQEISDSAIRIFFDTKLTLLEGFSTNNVCNADSIEIYPSVQITKPNYIAIPWIVDINQKYGEAAIEDAERQSYTADENGVFTLPKGGKMVYTCTGNFSGKRIVVTQPQAQLSLYGVYLNDASDDDHPFIEYQSSLAEENLKNVKIILHEDKITYLKKQNGGILKSVNNVEINNGDLDLGFGGTDLYLSCPNGYCMDVANSARILNDGSRYFVNSKQGIKAANISIGDEFGEEDYSKNKTTLVYAFNNQDYDIAVFERLYKGILYTGSCNVTANCFGTAYLGKIKNINNDEVINSLAERHNVIRDVTTFERSPFVYADESSDHFDDLNSNIILFDPNSSGEEPPSAWTVYTAAGSSYTKEQSDNRYILRTEYDAKISSLEATIASLLERVSALEGSVLSPELDNSGNLSLSHTEITDEGIVDLNRSEIDDNGNVILK